MKIKNHLFVSVIAFASLNLNAATFSLDPDSYANGADLTHAIPEVTLLLATSADNQTVIPSWYISAHTDSYSSTGGKVFGYLGAFASLWDGRRMRMDFASPVASVSIDFTSSFNDSGELHIFDSAWNELTPAFYTPSLAAHVSQTMTLSSAAENIAHAVAYTTSTGFGRLDNLRFSTTVPEPTSGALCGAAVISALLLHKNKKD